MILIDIQFAFLLKLDAMLIATLRYWQMGIGRNLKVGEIVEQLIEVKNTNIPITNIVFMGMGEPFKLRDVIESVKYLQIIKHLTWELNV